MNGSNSLGKRTRIRDVIHQNGDLRGFNGNIMGYFRDMMRSMTVMGYDGI
jgi:hypothetical protein